MSGNRDISENGRRESRHDREPEDLENGDRVRPDDERRAKPRNPKPGKKQKQGKMSRLLFIGIPLLLTVTMIVGIIQVCCVKRQEPKVPKQPVFSGSESGSGHRAASPLENIAEATSQSEGSEDPKEIIPPEIWVAGPGAGRILGRLKTYGRIKLDAKGDNFFPDARFRVVDSAKPTRFWDFFAYNPDMTNRDPTDIGLQEHWKVHSEDKSGLSARFVFTGPTGYEKAFPYKNWYRMKLKAQEGNGIYFYRTVEDRNCPDGAPLTQHEESWGSLNIMYNEPAGEWQIVSFATCGGMTRPYVWYRNKTPLIDAQKRICHPRPPGDGWESVDEDSFSHGQKKTRHMRNGTIYNGVDLPNEIRLEFF